MKLSETSGFIFDYLLLPVQPQDFRHKNFNRFKQLSNSNVSTHLIINIEGDYSLFLLDKLLNLDSGNWDKIFYVNDMLSLFLEEQNPFERVRNLISDRYPKLAEKRCVCIAPFHTGSISSLRFEGLKQKKGNRSSFFALLAHKIISSIPVTFFLHKPFPLKHRFRNFQNIVRFAHGVVMQYGNAK